MTKDDDLPAASGRPLPKRGLAASPGRKTAPAGTPANKLPAEVAPAALTPTSSRPPSGAQNTMSPPRTVGGHTARLFRGDAMDDSDLEAPDVIDTPRPRVQDRAARARAAAVAAALEADDDDEETVARIASRVKPPPAGARGGTMRMDASDRPPALGPHAVAAARKPPPAAPGPPPPLPAFDDLDSVDEDVPSTARGGRDRAEPVAAVRPAPAPAKAVLQAVQLAAPVVAAPVAAPAPAPAAVPVIAQAPPVAPPPAGEISISGSEFEATALPPQDVESRWPFAFAVGAVSLAIGSLLPLPFRQYIVPDHGPPAGASASASASAIAPASAVASTPVVADAHPTPVPHTATPVLPSALATVPAIAPTPTSSAARPPAFGSVKVPRPNPSTPKDVF